MNNLFERIPSAFSEEVFEDLINTGNVRIERILSKGHTSPESGWYEQAENEWVIVIEGAAIITFEDGREITLNKGDYLNILKHEKHRVSWSDPDSVTVWLAVFYQ